MKYWKKELSTGVIELHVQNGFEWGNDSGREFFIPSLFFPFQQQSETFSAYLPAYNHVLSRARAHKNMKRKFAPKKFFPTAPRLAGIFQKILKKIQKRGLTRRFRLGILMIAETPQAAPAAPPARQAA